MADIRKIPTDSDNSTKLSYVFNLKKHDLDLEFLDLDLTTDLHVYVDPILLYRSPISEYNEAHTLIVEFFKRAISFVKKGKHQIAQSMCQFPDAENLLGVAYDKPGHGPRKKLGYKIFNEVVNNADIQKNGLSFLNEFQLLIEGISFDLVSDAAVQISKDFFIRYTQRQCGIHNIRMENVPLDHCFVWADDDWDAKFENLPLNPFKKNKPFLLTPRTVVRKYPIGNYQEFYKEIYRYVLYEKEKQTLWKALGKEPKISFKDIEKKYKPSKKKIISYIKQNPNKKQEFYKIIKPSEETAWLEQLSLRWNINVNQIVLPEILDSLKVVFESVTAKNFLKRIRDPIEHQVKLKKPKKRVLPEIEELTRRCKQDMVLLLGNYRDDQGQERLKEIQSILSQHYRVILLSQIRQAPGDSLGETLARISTLAKFTVIEDSYPGGQLSEIKTIESIGVIAAILREKGKISSFMSLGTSALHTNMKEIDYELIPNNGIKNKYVKEAVDWAEQRYRENIDFWKDKYPWS